jgi:ribonucleotide reductase alpha subunit
MNIRRTAITNRFYEGLNICDVMRLAGRSKYETAYGYYLQVEDGLFNRERKATKYAVSRELLQKCCNDNCRGTKGGWLSDKVRHLLSRGVSPKDIPEIPEEIAGVLLTAHDISPESHVRIQAAFQEYVDNPVSKTVNLPPDAMQEDVDKLSRLTYELGCKGTTVYRDASRRDDDEVFAASDRTVQAHDNMLSPGVPTLLSEPDRAVISSTQPHKPVQVQTTLGTCNVLFGRHLCRSGPQI